VVSERLYFALLTLLALERGVELALSRRNAAWARRCGGVEYGHGHLRWMKRMHAAWFCSSVAEVAVFDRPFIPALGWSCLVLLVASQALRYWTIWSLGRRWNIGVIVVPGMSAEVRGPFRYLRHPNYLAVTVELLVVPLLHGAYLTAALFSALNALLLSVRIRCEEAALSEHCNYSERLGPLRRLWPSAPGAR
jgi:methyltransferase